jgi:hypothetical protein
MTDKPVERILLELSEFEALGVINALNSWRGLPPVDIPAIVVPSVDAATRDVHLRLARLSASGFKNARIGAGRSIELAADRGGVRSAFIQQLVHDRGDPPCHARPKSEWCDRDRPGGFMGHTCYRTEEGR